MLFHKSLKDKKRMVQCKELLNSRRMQWMLIVLQYADDFTHTCENNMNIIMILHDIFNLKAVLKEIINCAFIIVL